MRDIRYRLPDCPAPQREAVRAWVLAHIWYDVVGPVLVTVGHRAFPENWN